MCIYAEFLLNWKNLRTEYKMKKRNIRWSLIIYDIAILLFVDLVLLGLKKVYELNNKR